jgi:hypothetical protein
MAEIRNYTSIDDVRRHLSVTANKVHAEIAEAERNFRLYRFARLMSTDIHSKNDEVSLRRMLKSEEWATSFNRLDYLKEAHPIISCMENQVQNGLKHLSGAKKLLKEVFELKSDTEKGIEISSKVLSEIAKNNSPTNFKRQVKTLESYLKTRLDGKYRKLFVSFQVAPIDDCVHFVGYSTFSNLRSDNEYVYPKFYVALTQVIPPEGPSELHVNLLNRMKLPGKFKLSNAILKRDIISTANNLLNAEKFTQR